MNIQKSVKYALISLFTIIGTVDIKLLLYNGEVKQIILLENHKFPWISNKMDINPWISK